MTVVLPPAPPAPPDDRPWLKISDYARRHGVTRQTVWNWIRKGAVEVTRKAPRCAVRVRDCDGARAVDDRLRSNRDA